MKLKPVLLFSFLFLYSYISGAQSQGLVYKYDTTVKIFANGIQKRLAWCGGFNQPEFGFADLNHDNKKDLVIYERSTGVRTFINTGTAGNPNYIYAPEYELNFPEIDGSMKLIDYNCDGITDLFTTFGGFTAWRGYYNSNNQLSFKFYQVLQYCNDTFATGCNNAWVSPADIPEIVDVDHDGDLDFLSFDIDGNEVAWYKNVQVEEHLPCDTIRIKEKDKCWGKFYQNYVQTHVLNHNCNGQNAGLVLGPGEKKTHTGNALCLIDMDGDGDYDYLDGGVGFNNIVYLENGRIPYGTRDSMIYQDTTWSKTGYIVNLPTWPAPFFIDIDQDGKRDLLIAPNSKGENYKCILYFKNIGTDATPNFQFQSDTFLIDQTIDVGTAAYPMFYDYNKDGKPDLFIGSDGYYQPDGTLRSRISYYLNTSKVDSPSFVLQTTDFLGLSSFGFRGAALSVGDIDNDGKDDLIIGHSDGTLSYFKNAAASQNIQPDWQLGKLNLTDVGGRQINVGGNAAPFVYDLDKDGKPDLIIGQYGGYLTYYRNTAAVPGQVSMQLINSQLGGVKVDGPSYGECYSVPFIGKMDSSGAEYMLVGSNSGLLYRFTGFQKGDTSGTYLMIDSMYSFIDTAHLSINYRGNYLGFRSAPAIADVDGNGKLEMVVGDIWGGLKLYEQDSFVRDTNMHLTVAPITNNNQVTVYPNPANKIVTVSWSESFSNTNITIAVINTKGQKVLEKNVAAIPAKTYLDVKNLLPGIYYCVVSSERSNEVIRLAVIK